MMKRLIAQLRRPRAGPAGRVERRFELLALGLLVLLLLQLVFAGLRLFLRPQPEPVMPAVLAEHQGALLAVAPVSAAQSEEILARPLFWVSRRPAVAAGQENTAGEADTGGNLGKVKLVGLFGTGTTAGIIVLDGDTQRRVMQGESIEGWTLDSVRDNRVVVSRRGQEKTLVLLPRGEFYDPGSAQEQGAATESGKQPPGKHGQDKTKKVQPPSELGFGTPRFQDRGD